MNRINLRDFDCYFDWAFPKSFWTFGPVKPRKLEIDMNSKYVFKIPSIDRMILKIDE